MREPWRPTGRPKAINEFDAARIRHGRNWSVKGDPRPTFIDYENPVKRNPKIMPPQPEPVEQEAVEVVVEAPVIEAPQPVIPKDKPSKDAVIYVTVSLPSGEQQFRFVKRDVSANVPGAISRDRLRKMFMEGFAPLFGDVREGTS